MEEVAKRTFEIGVCLGRGGFGEVYRARMSSAGGLESDVAVKVLRQDLDPAGQAVQRLRDEGKLLARLNHPTILRVYDLVLLEGRISLVTEFIDGEDLAECMVGEDPLPLKALLEALGGVAGALDLAWNAPGPDGGPLQLVHRDIKPSNIRVSRHGQVKLLDFGIARSDSFEREARTQTNLMVGSPAYMAPERFLDSAVRPESDVFALGCCLYEGLASGRRFFENLGMPMMSALAVDPKRYEKHAAKRLAAIEAPPEVMAFLGALLAYAPEGRPSAADVMHRCEELADEVGGRSLLRWCRARKWADPAADEGPLQGRVITEGTMTRSALIASLPGQRRTESASLSPEEPQETTWEPVTASAEGGRVPPALSSESLAARRPGPTGATPAAAGRRPSVGLAVAGGVGVLGVGLLAVAVAAVVVIGGFAVSSGPEQAAAREAVQEVTPDDAEAPADEVAIEGTEEPPEPVDVEPETVPEAAPTPPPPRATSTRRAASTPPPAETPAPSGTAEPAPTPPATSGPAPIRVELQGEGASAWLVDGQGRRHPMPGAVPPGSYQIEATIDGEPVNAGGLLVTPEGGHVIDCRPRMGMCSGR